MAIGAIGIELPLIELPGSDSGPDAESVPFSLYSSLSPDRIVTRQNAMPVIGDAYVK